MKYILCLVVAVMALSAIAQVPAAEVQIKGAMLAAPTASKDGAQVYGYNEKSEFVVIRKGTNEMVCLADDPKQEGFSASCYHKDLDPFMERGRELKKEGKSPKEILEQREADVKSGKFKMPAVATTLFVYYAPAANYNAQSGEVTNGNFRYVVYIPYATAETTGLPLKPNADAPGMPWLMDPGTHRAHIMITPPSGAHH
ncbi:MAG TPA: hypothetical protein VK508_00535 [Cyclobacteriaceae bacterium]|nr:hypothetical protein [Cyclobacteriaceae bacterium]